MRVLIADDAKSRVTKFKPRMIGAIVDWADTPSSAIEHLKKSVEKPYDYVFLDRDYELTLGDKPGNGSEITTYIADNWSEWLHSTRFVIHSLNTEGAIDMAIDLQKVGAQYIVWPWAWVNTSPETLAKDFEDRIGKGFNLSDEEKIKRPPKLVEGRDYDVIDGLFIFTEYFLRQRGTCCENGCLNCPWK